MKRTRTFYIAEHGNKQRAFENALKRYGWKRIGIWNQPDVCLFDSDGPPARNELIAHQKNSGSRIVLYPHSAVPPYWYDCGMQWSECVDVNCVSAPMHSKLLKLYGYPRSIKQVGWSFCEMLPFRSSPVIASILFAPKHHNANGFLSQVDKDTNMQAFQILLKLRERYGFRLLVRHLGTLAASGLTIEKDVQYIAGNPDLSHEQIDRTDVVVSTHTFAYMSIARGCPTVMYGEEIAPHTGQSEESLSFCRRWSEYKDKVMYPFDLLGDVDPWECIHRAIRGNECFLDWKMNMIGTAFQPSVFAETLARLVEA